MWTLSTHRRDSVNLMWFNVTSWPMFVMFEIDFATFPPLIYAN